MAQEDSVRPAASCCWLDPLCGLSPFKKGVLFAPWETPEHWVLFLPSRYSGRFIPSPQEHQLLALQMSVTVWGLVCLERDEGARAADLDVVFAQGWGEGQGEHLETVLQVEVSCWERQRRICTQPPKVVQVIREMSLEQKKDCLGCGDKF